MSLFSKEYENNYTQFTTPIKSLFILKNFEPQMIMIFGLELDGIKTQHNQSLLEYQYLF